MVSSVAAIAIAFTWQQAKTRQIQDRVSAAPRTGTYVAADDAHIFVQRLGDPGAPAMVFIHGTGSWSETWRRSMETAVKQGYYAVALDLPPFGYSIPPANGIYTKPRQAARLLAALDSLGIRQATWVAHSFGAAPVMEALMIDPRRARAVVLVDAALGLESAQTDGSDNRVQRLLRQRWIAEAISATFLTNPAFSQKLLESFITEKEKAAYEWVELYQQPLNLSDSYQHIALWLPELVGDRGQHRSDHVANYAGLPFPLTLIWGETDSVTPLSQAQHLQSLMPNAQLVVIPKAGHIPQIEETAKFQEALAAAIRQE